MVFNNMLLWGGAIKDQIIVTIVGRNVVKEYNGSNQTITGYTVQINNPEYTTSDFTFTGSASATGKNVGTYNMGLTASQFTNTNSKYRNVTFVVTDGYVRIYGKTVTVTAVAKSKIYDGNPSTDPALTATVSGLLGTDTISYSLSRTSGQNAGSYTISPTGNATQGNYVVNYTTAKFTINPASCTLTAHSGSKTYNGSSQSITGYTCSVSGLAFSGVTASGSRKDYGTSDVVFSGVTINSTKDTTGNYVVTGTTKGSISITRRSVTVKADNKSKVYGTSDPALTATVTGTVGSDTVSYSLSRASGENVNSYTITPTGNATQGNYSVSYSTGSLTITKAAASALGLSVSGYSGTYNGSSHTITATVTISSGTTIRYSTDNSNWSTTKPTRTAVGTTTVYVKAENSNYNTATGNANITISKAAASGLGLSVTSYSGYYDGSAHTITATVSVSSGTTIKYSTDNTNWSTTKPTRKDYGTTTVYVKAENSNYNTATATGTIAITSNVAVSVSTTTEFFISSVNGTYESDTYTISAGTYWFDYLTPGQYIFHNETTGFYSYFNAPSFGYVVVP